MALTTVAIIFLSLLSACSHGSPLNKKHAIVELDNQVRIHGASAGNIESFLNIRFAKDTGGSNRFAPPEPYSYPYGSVINATRPGAACPQQKVPLQGLELFDNVTHISEDCLTLRVDRPANTSSTSKLPVMAYIYGGGDSIGQIYDSIYEPGPLISNAVQRGFPVVYVAMNYRVGVFGFAASPALNATDSLNVGLLDQRLGLSWVQQHISAFGGDPDNVTIFGESDGATGVGLQITAYGGDIQKTPFKRAIMQSGSPASDLGTASNISAVRTGELIKKVNCTSSASEAEFACLRKLPLNILLSAAVEYEFSVTSSGFDAFIPTSPSTFIPDSPSTLLTSGRFARDIDIIAGWTEDDQSFFTPTTLNSTTDLVEFIYSQFPAFSERNVQRVLSLYPVTSFSGMPAKNISAQYFRASRMIRDAQDACPSLHMVRMNHKYSDEKTSNYLYVLNQTLFAPLFAEAGTPYLGVPHFSDIPYVFNLANTRYSFLASPADRKLSTEMSSSWASFAAFGEPSGRHGTIFNWYDAMNQSSQGQYNLRVLGGPNEGAEAIGHGKNFYEELARRCDFWNSAEVLREMAV
ncbi:carboxylesterase [Penicillium samsonianum]|uniref:carboxylesterase n=1 Tax=Penicillium samsonianum TaxID=1882272 RepID=UPI002547A8A5|nr:carboxylesterase [Penicillium samsonianum]KAJ6127818.1 carboxylesterase [Penicillium samsonianum]